MSIIHLNNLTVSFHFGKRLSKILIKTILTISENENGDRPNSAPW